MLGVDGEEVQQLVENLDAESRVENCALWDLLRRRIELLKFGVALREKGLILGYFRLLLENDIIEPTDFVGVALQCGIEVTDLQIRCSQVSREILVFLCQGPLLTC